MTALRDAIDTTTLGWIKPELDETLRQARRDIEAFAEDPADTNHMRFCASFLHQVHGTLRMVELYAPAMVAEEMERLALALVVPQGAVGAVADRDEACAALMRGVVLLPDYLERLQGGHKDIPIVLLPLLNELRAARGETGLSESVLFAPEPRPPAARRTCPRRWRCRARAASSWRASSCPRCAMRLAQWPEDGAPSNIGGIAKAIEGLLESADHEATRRMLWVGLVGRHRIARRCAARDHARCARPSPASNAKRATSSKATVSTPRAANPPPNRPASCCTTSPTTNSRTPRSTRCATPSTWRRRCRPNPNSRMPAAA